MRCCLGPAIHVAAPRGKQIEASLSFRPSPDDWTWRLWWLRRNRSGTPTFPSACRSSHAPGHRSVLQRWSSVRWRQDRGHGIGRAAGIEVQVPDNMAELVVDADFGQPIPAKAALEVLAEQVDAELVATDQLRFTRMRDDRGCTGWFRPVVCWSASSPV